MGRWPTVRFTLGQQEISRSPTRSSPAEWASDLPNPPSSPPTIEHYLHPLAPVARSAPTSDDWSPPGPRRVRPSTNSRQTSRSYEPRLPTPPSTGPSTSSTSSAPRAIATRTAGSRAWLTWGCTSGPTTSSTRPRSTAVTTSSPRATATTTAGLRWSPRLVAQATGREPGELMVVAGVALRGRYRKLKPHRAELEPLRQATPAASP